jgi:hypothetical protein
MIQFPGSPWKNGEPLLGRYWGGKNTGKMLENRKIHVVRQSKSVQAWGVFAVAFAGPFSFPQPRDHRYTILEMVTSDADFCARHYGVFGSVNRAIVALWVFSGLYRDS